MFINVPVFQKAKALQNLTYHGHESMQLAEKLSITTVVDVKKNRVCIHYLFITEIVKKWRLW